jgi:hypothetical protein
MAPHQGGTSHKAAPVAIMRQHGSQPVPTPPRSGAPQRPVLYLEKNKLHDSTCIIFTIVRALLNFALEESAGYSSLKCHSMTLSLIMYIVLWGLATHGANPPQSQSSSTLRSESPERGMWT